MPRAIWTGTISFGLVSVPVRLYPATRRKDVRFHELDRLTGQRVHHQRVVTFETPSPALPTRGREIDEIDETPSPETPQTLASHVSRGSRGPAGPPTRGRETDGPARGREVAAEDLLKGFEVARNQYVTVAREELEEMAPERTRTIDVEQFVDAAAIDPIYYDTSYYVVAERAQERAFGLLVEAMEQTKRIAICWFVLRRKRYLAGLRPHGRVMVLATMFHADEILPIDEQPPAPGDLRKNEREMAALLIKTLSGPFEPERYPDEYRRRLTALIEGRAAAAVPVPPEVLTGSAVPDLMAALRASVEQARRASKGSSKPVARRKRKTA
jgi:DNA end-binding protein Ku